MQSLSCRIPVSSGITGFHKDEQAISGMSLRLKHRTFLVRAHSVLQKDPFFPYPHMMEGAEETICIFFPLLKIGSGDQTQVVPGDFTR